MHYKRPPVPSTERFVAEAPFAKLRTGTQAVVEIVTYPDGQVRLTASSVSGAAGSPRIVQGPFLMFVDADEAKDALDLLVDRLDDEAGDETTADVGRRGVELACHELERRGARVVARGGGRRRNGLEIESSDGRRHDVYVKTRRRGDWQSDTRLGRPQVSKTDDRVWLFVDLTETPTSFRIVPAGWMENDIYENHAEYLRRHGGQRAENPLTTHHRIQSFRVEPWRDRWDLLGLA